MSPPPYSVMVLGPADVSLVRQLNEVFAEAFGDADSYRERPPDDGYLERLLARDHIAVIVSMIEGRVVAGLVAYELEKFESRRSEYYLYDLAVDARHRRRGLAAAMIERLREIARLRGAWVIYVQADHGDEPAIALYEGLGSREEVIHFDIPVARARK